RFNTLSAKLAIPLSNQLGARILSCGVTGNCEPKLSRTVSNYMSAPGGIRPGSARRRQEFIYDSVPGLGIVGPSTFRSSVSKVHTVGDKGPRRSSSVLGPYKLERA